LDAVAATAAEIAGFGWQFQATVDDDATYGQAHRARDCAFILNAERRHQYLSAVKTGILQTDPRAPLVPALTGPYAVFAPAIDAGKSFPAGEFEADWLREIRAKRSPVFVTPAIGPDESEKVMKVACHKLAIAYSAPRAVSRASLVGSPAAVQQPFVILRPAAPRDRAGICGRPDAAFAQAFAARVRDSLGDQEAMMSLATLEADMTPYIPGLRFAVGFTRGTLKPGRALTPPPAAQPLPALPAFVPPSVASSDSYDETDSFQGGGKERAKESSSSSEASEEGEVEVEVEPEPEVELGDGVPLLPPPEIFNPGIPVHDVDPTKARATMELLTKTSPAASKYTEIFGSGDQGKPLTEPNPTVLAQLGEMYGFAQVFARFKALPE
jgi:hypothetical protein